MDSTNEKAQDSPLDHCGEVPPFVRGALLLQEKWVLLIIFSLLEGPSGFSELTRRGNVNTATLAQRLSLLEKTGLVSKTIHSTMPPRTSYTLTEAGSALTPIIAAINDWSKKYLPAEPPPGLHAGSCRGD